MPDDPFEKLKQATIKAQTAGGKNPVLPTEVNYGDLNNRFMFSGYNFKGQVQSCYSQTGKGFSGSASWDPLALIGLKAELEGSAGATRSAQLMLIVHRHGPKILGGTNHTPLALYVLGGRMWEAKVGASFEVGVSASLGQSVGANSQGLLPDDKNKFKIEYPKFGDKEKDKEKDGGSESWAVEIAAFKLEAKAAAKASASYTYQNVYVEDPRSAHYQDDEADIAAMRQRLVDIFKKGLIEKDVIEAAGNFINQNPSYFYPVKKSGSFLFFGVDSYDPREIYTSLRKTVQGLGAKPSISQAERKLRRIASTYAGDVARVAEISMYGNPSCALWLSSHSPTGEAGLSVSLGLSLTAAGLKEEASASAKALQIKGSYKRASYRYQCLVNAEARVYMTQDTIITYEQIEFDPLKTSGSIKVTVGMPKVSGVKNMPTVPTKTLVSLEGKGGLDKKVLLNRMRYQSAVVYWSPPETRPNQLPKATVERKVAGVDGSGVCFGTSLELDNLCDLMRSYDPDEQQFAGQNAAIAHTYLTGVAETLRVDPQDMIEFLFPDPDTQSELLSLFVDLKRQKFTSLLIESAYALAGERTIDHSWDSSRSGFERHTVSKKTLGEMSSAVENASGATRRGMLQSLRIRYRLRDLFDDDETTFTLGFKILGVGAKFNLDSVNRAGSDGIVDLKTLWKPPACRNLTADAAYNLETSVPPVILFCQ